MYVSIGGIGQWIQVGADHPNRPALLYLHGGPGATSRLAAEAWRPWEDYFTVVHWDQRGAGRTLAKNGEDGCKPLTIDRMVQDGIEVAQFLIAKLHKPKILIVGHSWGSALAVFMLKRRPDLFSAFVGTGQLVNSQQNETCNYRKQLQQAEARGDHEAVQSLRSMGPPPFPDVSSIRTLRELADRLAPGDGDSVLPRPSPRPTDFTAEDFSVMLKGFEFSARQLYQEIAAIDLPVLGLDFDVPMFFFEGTCDQQTPMELAERYFDSIMAPHKEFVRFEGCHHFVVMNRPADFLRNLVARVIPHIQ